ncbi:MAG TPA: cation-translocating P-type ATPase [Candidatus Limnocylindria bacterium]|nr:cation-translocating P-type ATPase [Candidatus Limnocylindria bacterium]
MAATPWYQQTADEVRRALDSDLKAGLTSQEAARRLEQYGPNERLHKKGPGLLQMFVDQLKDYMIVILVIASLVSILVGEYTDSVIIIAIVIINAILGVSQEFRAEKALAALKKMSAPNAKVIRDGTAVTVPSGEVVPGDVVVLETGDYVPADVRLANSINLKVEEAALTGESVPVDKHAEASLTGDVALGDQINSGFMSTLVTYGRGTGIVTATGMNTVIGSIATMIQDVPQEDTPLQKKLTQMGKMLGTACLVICGIVFLLGLIRGEHILAMFMTAVSLAVAAIPEGLPAVVTIVLAIGMQRMVKRNAIMKKLHAVETLGGTTVICSDKTGTLTQNQMTIVKMYVPGMEMSVEGDGYRPAGAIYEGARPVSPDGEPAVRRLLEIQALCNDARLERLTDNLRDEWHIAGDPTEGAMIVAAAKAGIDREDANRAHPRLQEIPFDSERKLMTTFHGGEDGGLVSFTKGAPDLLVERCTHIMRRDGAVAPIGQADIDAILEENHRLASQALRVLAMAFKPLSEVPAQPSPDRDENGLVFCGLVGMIDPPRAEAIEAIKVCKSAGIRVVMITGDYRDTAAAIARQLGLIESDGQVLGGADLNLLDDAQFAEAAKTVNVYARVSPAHKVRIVQAMKENGNITAMTGDGVNDAPALKRADIGIAMGITGTDVTKETADMIITDDNFASIVSAVEEGRVIYSNIRKFVFFLMSCNVGEILIVFLAMLLGWPIPLLPIHLLWINLLTDAFPALALGTEKREPGVMQEKPRDPKATIIDRTMVVNIAVQSGVMTVAVLAAFYIGWTTEGVAAGRTFALLTICLSELIRAYSSRSEKSTVFELGVFSNRSMNLAFVGCMALLLGVALIPGLRDVFSLTTHNLQDWIWIFGLGVSTFVFAELTKVIRRAARKARGADTVYAQVSGGR